MPASPPLAPTSDPTPDDADLMQRIVAQDQAALLALYERFGSQVYGLTLRVLRDSRLAENLPALAADQATPATKAKGPVSEDWTFLHCRRDRYLELQQAATSQPRICP